MKKNLILIFILIPMIEGKTWILKIPKKYTALNGRKWLDMVVELKVQYWRANLFLFFMAETFSRTIDGQPRPKYIFNKMWN